MESWGMPGVTASNSEVRLLIWQHWRWLDRKLSIHATMLEGRWEVRNFKHKPSVENGINTVWTVKKNCVFLDFSNGVDRAKLPQFIWCFRLWMNEASCVLHESPLHIPCCTGQKNGLPSPMFLGAGARKSKLKCYLCFRYGYSGMPLL